MKMRDMRCSQCDLPAQRHCSGLYAGVRRPDRDESARHPHVPQPFAFPTHHGRGILTMARLRLVDVSDVRVER
jgi:hypothetical protein